jgi:hypothetical protein
MAREVRRERDARAGKTPRIDPNFTDFEPQTELGWLLKARRASIASGRELLDEEGFEREIAERRGGVRYEDE